jgi:hypothetical protein
MDRTCTLCNVTTSSGYRWESHLSTDAHRNNQMKSEHEQMLSIIENLVRFGGRFQDGERGGAVMGSISICIDDARKILETMEEWSK